MKTETRSIMVSLTALAALAVISVSCCSIIGCVTPVHEPWSFVQAVGGIKVGEPHAVSNGVWTIPVECDVSGLTAVTTKPTTTNSARVVKNIGCKVKGDRILIWVVTCVVTDRYKEPHWTQSVPLAGAKEGKYRLQYLNPDGSTVGIRSAEFRK